MIWSIAFTSLVEVVPIVWHTIGCSEPNLTGHRDRARLSPQNLSQIHAVLADHGSEAALYQVSSPLNTSGVHNVIRHHIFESAMQVGAQRQVLSGAGGLAAVVRAPPPACASREQRPKDSISWTEMLTIRFANAAASKVTLYLPMEMRGWTVQHNCGWVKPLNLPSVS